MAEIVNNLFGIDPAALQQSNATTDFAQAYRFAQLSPLERANMAIYQGGAGLARGTAQLLGGDEQLNRATALRQLANQFDLTSPEGLRQYASAASQIDPRVGAAAAAEAERRRTLALSGQKTALDIQRTTQEIDLETKLRDALAKLPENATEQQYLAVFRQFGSPDQQARVIQQILNNRAKLAAKASEDGGVGTAGPVGKTGAFRDINGTVFGPAEMKVVRGEFKGAQDLLDTLNKISAQDIKDAESFVDWTTKSSEVKALAKSKTLSAQSKIAASQLLEQIESLPPGSASDADMRAAMKNFPGYSDPVALQDWVNRTKAKLQSRLERVSDQFGFKPTVTSSGNIDLKAKPAAATVSTSDMDLITKYSTPQPAAQR